ncbi:hypothetical protein QCE62_10595 [Caballeronia sp. LZ033]|nr:hypothetical protein [Caballeronia sp. LZ033]
MRKQLSPLEADESGETLSEQGSGRQRQEKHESQPDANSGKPRLTECGIAVHTGRSSEALTRKA